MIKIKNRTWRWTTWVKFKTSSKNIKKHPELKKEYEQESHDFDVAISEKTLKVMDDSIANFKKGKVSAPVDLSDFEK